MKYLPQLLQYCVGKNICSRPIEGNYVSLVYAELRFTAFRVLEDEKKTLSTVAYIQFRCIHLSSECERFDTEAHRAT